MKAITRVTNQRHRRQAAALAAIGGEPLAGSGFETESPDPDFLVDPDPLPAGSALADTIAERPAPIPAASPVTK